MLEKTSLGTSRHNTRTLRCLKVEPSKPKRFEFPSGPHEDSTFVGQNSCGSPKKRLDVLTLKDTTTPAERFSILQPSAANRLQRTLKRHLKATSTSLKRLSSGKRINTAKDDAAGLAITSRLSARLRSTGRALRNVADALSLTHFASDATQQLGGVISDMRALATQAASDLTSPDDKARLDLEFTDLRKELDRIVKTTTWGETHLLSSQRTSSVSFFVGVNASLDAFLYLDPVDLSSASLGDTYSPRLSDSQIKTSEIARQALDTIAFSDAMISRFQSHLGALTNRLLSVDETLSHQRLQLTSIKARVQDLDFAREQTQHVRSSILADATRGLMAQANQRRADLVSLLT